jgi:hypothetical protein
MLLFYLKKYNMSEYDASTYIGYLKRKNGGFKIVSGKEDNRIIKNRDYILKELLGGLKENKINISRLPEYFSALEGKYIRNLMQGSSNTDAIEARHRTKKITEKTIKGGFDLYGDKVKNILESNAPILYKKFEKKFKVVGGRVSKELNSKSVYLDGGKRRFSLASIPVSINHKPDYINRLIQKCKEYIKYYEKEENEEEYDLYYNTYLLSIINSSNPQNIRNEIDFNTYKYYTKNNDDNYSESESDSGSDSDSDNKSILTKKQKQIKVDNVIKYIAVTIIHYYNKLNLYSTPKAELDDYDELILTLLKIRDNLYDNNLSKDDIKSIIKGVIENMYKWNSEEKIVVFN